MARRICLPLALDDAMRVERSVTNATGNARKWLLAELRILLGRLDATDPQVSAMLAAVQTMEVA